MTPFLIGISYWLHSLATVIFIGHFVLLAVIYIPAHADTPTALSSNIQTKPLVDVCFSIGIHNHWRVHDVR